MSHSKKLESYKFEDMLIEPTYGEEIVRSELSMGAYELINEWQRDVFFNKEFLRDYFQLRKMPVYEKVIDFFYVYGGRIFCYQDSSINNDTVTCSPTKPKKGFEGASWDVATSWLL